MTKNCSNHSIRLAAYFIPVVIAGFVWFASGGAVSSRAGQSRDAQKKTELAEHFKKWLKQDVVYIITPEEKEIFSKLVADEEREQFIEQFWQRRDPDPATAENEAKVEHYRRIQYANDFFRSGEAGWKTDRGMIYIMYGPPTEVTRYSGGQYERPYNEGGGVTTTYPFEKWVYRHLEGIGDYIELEFVDEGLAGEYHLAMSPWEKDALLNVPNAGLTFAESIGLASKSDRIRNLYAGNAQTGPMDSPGFRDSIFERMHRFFSVQRPPTIQFKDLKEKVTAKVQFSLVPFQLRADWIYLANDEAMVPITLKVNNKELTYQEMLGSLRATVNVYGAVQNLQGRMVAEFEDTLTTDYTQETYINRSFQNSVYQKRLVLKPGLYRLDIVVKDVAGDKLGTVQTRLQIPRIASDALSLSPVILSKKVQELQGTNQAPGLFELGDLKIIPEVGDTFTPRDQLHFYAQAYNMKLDQITGNPSVAISYLIRGEDGSVIERKTDEDGKLIHFHSPQRVVCLGGVSLKNFRPGSYRIDLEIQDRLSNQQARASASFRLNTDELQAGK